MISVIVCSTRDDRFAAVSAMYARQLASVPHEVIRVPDAASPAEGYNRGVRRSRGDVLVLSHDDVGIISPDLPGRIHRYLAGADLVGVAGTSRLVGPAWAAAGPPYLHGRVAQPVLTSTGRPAGFAAVFYGPPAPPGASVQAMDGLFLAVWRTVAEAVPFDQDRFDGPNVWDVDFTFSAHRAGFRLAVCDDVHVVHAPAGNRGGTREQDALRFMQKHQPHLPAFRPRRFEGTFVVVPTRDELVEVMSYGASTAGGMSSADATPPAAGVSPPPAAAAPRTSAGGGGGGGPGMFSVIMCSINDARFAAASDVYRQQLASVPHEIVRIPDARSLAEGYNRGIRRSRGDVLILSHDDVEIISPDLPGRLRSHLADSDLVGVAGTSLLVDPGWVSAGPPYIHGQVAHPLPGAPGFGVEIYGPPAPPGAPVQAMDGLFLAMRRSVAEAVPFDEALFDGFHLYDVDFTFSAHLAGYRLAVCHDIHLIHRSGGDFEGGDWGQYARLFRGKRGRRLPRFAPRRYNWAGVAVATREEVSEVMAYQGANGG